MYLHTLVTAVPEQAYTQKECAEMLRRSDFMHTLDRRSVLMLLAILRGDCGIAKRHFALPDIEAIFRRTPDELNEAFRREAPRLAARALRSVLELEGITPRQLDALLVCTCTGYLCPGVTSYVAEQLGLRSDAFLHDLVGLGCGAAIPMLRAADALLAREPEARVATVAVEICSAAFYLDNDPGVLISACIFGDGAAAALWRSRPRESGPALRCGGFHTRHEPAHRDRIRFEQRNGRLRNLLDLQLPGITSSAVSALLASDQAGRGISRIISHGGGRDVLDAISAALPEHDFTVAREVLRNYGNMSSPSVLFALRAALDRALPAPGSDWWVVSFGAGFSIHSCRLRADA